MKAPSAILLVLCAAAVSGCGGGGGGGDNGNAIPLGTFTSGSNRPGLATFSPNVKTAAALGSDIQITGEERVGDTLNYDVSRRLTMTLYGPVTIRSYTVNNSRQPGTCLAVYIVTRKASNGKYFTEGEWRGTSGSVNVTAVNSAHIQATFDATMLNIADNTTFRFTNGKLNLGFDSPPPPGG